MRYTVGAMLMLKALRERSIALLWGGQALSAIGDEIYRVALIWLAVGLIGESAGYLASAQSASLLVLSLVGGYWADRWDRRRTMIGVDAVRAAVALVPVAAFYAGRVSLPVLTVVAVVLSGLGAFFDPALQALLPDVSPDPEILQAATGLMGTTVRLARAVGPGVVGLLGAFVPTIHFFTLDAASFAVSALSVKEIPAPPPEPATPGPRPRLMESLLGAWRSARAHRLVADVMLARAAVSGLWALAYGLGLALLVQRLAPGDVRAFGLMVACYGAGNVAGALFVGNIRRTRPARILFGGYAWMGLGFIGMGLAPGLRALGAAGFWAGIGGPVNDVPFFDLVQAGWPTSELARMFRLRMSTETGAAMLVMAVSPLVFRAWPPRAVVAACGAAFLALGAAGLFAHAEPAAD